MTADQLKNTEPEGMTHSRWLKEIAYQLALMNENATAKAVAEIVAPKLNDSPSLNKPRITSPRRSS